MPKYMIEREIPGAGKMSDQEYKEAAQKSCDVLREMGPEIQWMESYVTDDKIFCVYYAESERLIREHAQKAGFPADKIATVRRVIDPVTAEVEPAEWRKDKPAHELQM